MTNERDRNREERLERLFRAAGPEYLPVLTPDPGLPARVRALAAAGESGREPAWRRWTPRVAWVSLAGATVAASIFIGGFMGYHAATDLAANEALDAEILTAAWSQSGSVEDLDAFDDEVAE
jgi:anti-sigma factor RsiW